MPNYRILLAAVIAVLLVAGAYVLGKGVNAPVAEASTETALLEQIATKDSSGDGLPDWQKQLYGIPLNATTTDYFGLGMTDGEAVAKGLIVPKAVADIPSATSSASSPATGVPPAAPAGTLTDAFAKNFFTLYLAAKEQNNGGDLTSDQMNALADQAYQTLVASVAPAPDFKQEGDLTVSGSGSVALASFAANAEGVFAAQHSTLPESELQYLSDALNGDTSAVGHIGELAKAYRDTAAGLAAVPVPREASAPDLALINALMRVGQISADFARVNDDPAAAMLALEQYPDAVKALASAFQGIASAYQAAGVVVPKGTPGAEFVGLMQSVEASSTAP